MEAFLTSNEWPWRLARTIVQGVLGVVVANVDMLVGCVVLEPEWRAVVVALVMAVLSPVMAELGAALPTGAGGRRRGRPRAPGDRGRVRKRGGAQGGAGRPLRGGPGARERDPVVTREDARWGAATALAVLLCLGALPLMPLPWLVGRLDP